MGFLDNIGTKRDSKAGTGGQRPPRSKGTVATRQRSGTAPKGASGNVGRPSKGKSAASSGASPLPWKRGKKKPRDKVAGAAAPLHDRRRRLVGAREATLRDLGGLMLEMYKRNRFREELLLDKCEEVLAIEVEVAHIDQRLFQLAPPNAVGVRPIGRCECGSPIHPGQNFCGVCGRPFSTLTQTRQCNLCGAGLRPGDSFCSSCGNQAPDLLEALEAGTAGPSGGNGLEPPPLAQDVVEPVEVTVEAAAPAPPPLEESPAEQAPTAKPPATASAAQAAAPDDTLVLPETPAAPATPAQESASPVAPQPAPQPAAPPAEPGPPSLDDSTPAPTPLHAVPPAEPEPAASGQPDAAVAAAINAALDALPAELRPRTEEKPSPKVRKVDPADAEELDRRQARKLAREKAKRVERLKKAKAQANKERAKRRAKAARELKKRGGEE